jgi:lipoprotein
MEKMSFYHLLLIGLLVGFSSCQKEQIYSCDPEIDDWVSESLSEIHSLSRSSWLKLEEPLKIPAFRAFTAKQKQAFWKSKIQETLILDWNNQEKEHLRKLYEFIDNNSDLFERNALNNEDIYDEFDRFKYEWIDYAEETLGWSHKLVGNIIASGNKLKNKAGILEITPLTYSSKIKSSSESGKWDRDCNCDSYDDWCWNGPCFGGACNASLGCGTLLLGNCDGICVGP